MKTRFLLFIFGLFLTAASTQSAQAQLIPVTTCGQTLAAAGEYILASNLNCSGVGDYSGVTITASNVMFHLAGRSISSADCDLNRNLSGIFVAGGLTGVRIDGGTINGFNDGIVLSSSNSRVEGMTIRNACSFGIAVQGANNQITTNTVTASGDGVALVPSDDSRVHANNLSGNLRAGLVISDSSERNRVENNILNNNGANTGEGYGVAIFNGSGNIVRHNAANYNDFGVRLSSPNNFVYNNVVSGNSQNGVWLTTDGSPSSVRRNSVFGNGLSDMLDDSPSCGGNVWRNNRFITDLVNAVPDGGPNFGCLR